VPEYDRFVAAQNMLGARFQKVSRGHKFDAMLPKPRVGLILVGGPRNRYAKIPAGTRRGLTAAFKAVVRAQKALEAKQWT
jgi:hypothetical protein